MRTLTTLLFTLLTYTSSFSQNLDVSYIPEPNDKVTMSEYNRGKELLHNAYDQYTGDGKVTYVDFWNVAFALSHMGVEKEIILSYLRKAKATDSESFCKIANFQIDRRGGLSETPFYKLLGEAYTHLISDCSGIIIEPVSMEARLREKEKLELARYNERLIDKLITLMDMDQRYRTSSELYKKNQAKQDRLDAKVQEKLTLILEKYGYPGKELVGEPFMNYACLLIEHGGKLDYQEKYLPMVVEAYHKGQVDKAFLTMLIDRVQWKKTGKQIYGSHMGVPFESAKVISEVKSKYGLR